MLCIGNTQNETITINNSSVRSTQKTSWEVFSANHLASIPTNVNKP